MKKHYLLVALLSLVGSLSADEVCGVTVDVEVYGSCSNKNTGLAFITMNPHGTFFSYQVSGPSLSPPATGFGSDTIIIGLIDLAAEMITIDIIAGACEGSTSFIVPNLDITDITTSTTPTTCPDSNDGTITVKATSNDLPLTFTLGSDVKTDNESATFMRPAGMYTIQITNDAGCQAMATNTIKSPPSLQVTTMTTGTCENEADGSLEVAVTGGTGPYTGCITGITDQMFAQCKEVPGTFTELPVGSYHLQVTDAHGCLLTRDVTIEQLTSVMIKAISSMSPECHGYATGEIRLIAASGEEQLSFALYKGSTLIDTQYDVAAADFKDLNAGTYKIVVTNLESGCTAEAQVMLLEPMPLRVVTEVTDTSCGKDNGTIVCNQVFGGTPPYLFSIGGAFQSEPLFLNLPGGPYLLVVKDANNCTKEIPLYVNPSEPVVITKVETESPTCPKYKDGSLIIYAQSPEQPLKYTISGRASDEQTTNSGFAEFTGLPAGDYTVQVSDPRPCIAQTNAIIEPISPIVFREPHLTPVSCCGAKNGMILLTREQVIGGTPPYTYSIGTQLGFIPVGEPFTNLKAGTYSITVEDAHGCDSVSKWVKVDPAESIKICKVFTTPARCPREDGTIRVFAKSKAELQYALDDGPFQTSPLFTDLAPGTYKVTVNRKGDYTSECTCTYVKVKKSKHRTCN